MNKIQAVYTAVNIRLQLQPTKLIGRSKFIIEFMASLHPYNSQLYREEDKLLTDYDDLLTTSSSHYHE